MVTQSWDTIPLHLEITLWIFLAPFTITEVTLLTMYVFLNNNTFVTMTHGLANAFKKIFLKLQDHLLGRLIGHEFDANMHKEFMDSDWNSIHFVGSNIYSVQTCNIYYTSYDLQRQCDTVNPHTHPDIMLCSPVNEEGAEPYWYVRVLGIYHANIWAENLVVPGARNRFSLGLLVWWGTWLLFGILLSTSTCDWLHILDRQICFQFCWSC